MPHRLFLGLNPNACVTTWQTEKSHFQKVNLYRSHICSKAIGKRIGIPIIWQSVWARSQCCSNWTEYKASSNFSICIINGSICSAKPSSSSYCCTLNVVVEWYQSKHISIRNDLNSSRKWTPGQCTHRPWRVPRSGWWCGSLCEHRSLLSRAWSFGWRSRTCTCLCGVLRSRTCPPSWPWSCAPGALQAPQPAQSY